LATIFIQRRLRLATYGFFLATLFTFGLGAQIIENPENFKVEITGSVWFTSPTGTIQASGTPINLITDLGAGAEQPHFYGRLVFKPTRKQRIFVEGSPISFSGMNTIGRSFVFLNKTYNISQTVSTSANVAYVFGGYQYDPLSGAFGHLGLQAGIAYLGVQGELHGIQSGIVESKTYKEPVPLVGTEFRVFPIPHKRIIQVEGFVRGMSAGGYGYLIEGGGSAGLRIGPFAVLGGYRETYANVHGENASANGVALRLKGPILAVQWAW
jgi:hypothetical protein